MRFLREIFMNTAQDCEWLRSAHLGAVSVPNFRSFTLAGNEDAPARVDLYEKVRPEYNDKPVAVFLQNDVGDLFNPEAVATVKRIQRTRVR